MHSAPREMAQPLDIIFISYDESNADENWHDLRARFPRAKRVHGVKGIAKAHQQAALKSDTHFFYVVDGDNKIKDDFSFDYQAEPLEEESLYVFRCLNPVNELIYGFGAVKIYNKKLLDFSNDKKYVDLATTVTTQYRIIHQVASETIFFHTPEEAWRGAFRECAKLAAGTIKREKSKETLERLEKWCSVKNDTANADWVILGANQGREFVEKRRDELGNINNYIWLKEYFNEYAKNRSLY